MKVEEAGGSSTTLRSRVNTSNLCRRFFAFIPVLLLSLRIASAQSADLRFVVASFDGVNYDVTLQIKSNTSTFTLGVSSFVFTYDSSALSLNTSFTKHNFSGGSYSAQSLTVMPPKGTIVVFLLPAQPSTVVPLTWFDIATVHFVIKNPAGQSNLAWDGAGTYMFTSSASTVTENLLTGLNSTPLPVELQWFRGSAQRQSVRLEWSTATETQNAGFSVERMTSTHDWTPIGYVPGNGTSATEHTYSWIDEVAPIGNTSYRLKQIDVAGSFEYSEIVTVQVSTSERSTLGQNYPNPFNPSTTIQFQLATDGMIRLAVYDLLGRNVKTLVNGFETAGSHTVHFDATELASGSYICRLETHEGIEYRKLVLKK